MEDKKQNLERLKKRNIELKPIIFKRFNNEDELKRYKEENKIIFLEYYDNDQQIDKLKYELMTPKEREKYDKKQRFLELKAKGEPFDFSEFDDLND